MNLLNFILKEFTMACIKLFILNAAALLNLFIGSKRLLVEVFVYNRIV